MMAGNKTRPLVLITNKIISDGPTVKELMASCDIQQYTGPGFMTREDILAAIKTADAALIQSEDIFDRELIEEAGPQLKVIATMSVGVDHIDLPECAKRNIKVGHTPDVSTNAVAEETVGLLIATARKFKEGIQDLSDGLAWDALNENQYALCGPEIRGSVVGIVGLGRIGMAVAKLLVPFGISRLLYSSSSSKSYAAEVNAEYVSFDELLKQSDFVICCCSLKPENNNMFNSAAFKKMKKSAVFINTSRGAVVDQNDLAEALKNVNIFAAGLDVTTPEPLPAGHPLLLLKNCLILPHIGCSTFPAAIRMAELSAKNVLAGLRDEPLPCPVAI